MAEYIVEADCEYSDELHQVIERIVRCKDCKFASPRVFRNDTMHECYRLVHEFNVEPNGFCAWGECL